MAPYLVLLAVIPLVAEITKPDEKAGGRKAFYFIVFGFMMTLAAVRSYTVGVDTEQYCNAYLRFGIYDIDFSDSRYEPGFQILLKALNAISGNYQLLLIVSSLFIFGSVAVFFYRMSEHHALSAFLFVCLTTYFMYMNAMRQAIAIAIILIALPGLIRNRKWLLFAVFVILAAQFHQSAYLALVLIPLAWVPFDKKAIIAYLILMAALVLATSFFTENIASLLGKDTFYSAKYSGSNYFGGLIKALFVFFLCFVSVFLILRAKKQDKSVFRNEKINIDLVLHMLMLWAVFSVFGMRVEIAGRLGLYFGIVAPVAVSSALWVHRSRNGAYARWAICSTVLTYFLVVSIFRPEWQGAIPYVADFARVAELFF